MRQEPVLLLNFCDQAFPHAVGIVIKQVVDIGRECQPVATVKFAFELTRSPASATAEHTEWESVTVNNRLLDHIAENVCIGADVQAGQNRRLPFAEFVSPMHDE